MNQPIYVVGHQNPDTDSIASAMGYAWLIKERDGENVIAARAGACNPQTLWVLNHLHLDMPVLLTDASPRFDTVTKRLDTATPDKPLRDAWAIASRTGGVAPIINPDGTPYGLVTGPSLFQFFNNLVGTHPQRQEIKVSEILEMPCYEAANKNVPHFQATTRIRDVINRILREEYDKFWVVDEEGRYKGICWQRDLLNPPRIKIILVDHNEAQQAVASINEAELIEVLDHHKLGNPSTHVPIRFTVDPVGSTGTLVSERIENAGLSAPPELAGALLAGLLADTLLLTSPTTTVRDSDAADRLARWAFVGGSILENESIQSFGKKVLMAGAGLGAREPYDIVNGDMKIYHSGEIRFAISQAEVSDLYEVTEYLEKLSKALGELRERNALDFTVLMVTDVVQGSSKLLIDNPLAQLDDLPYPPLNDGTRKAEGVVSRKKQLLPVILSLLET